MKSPRGQEFTSSFTSLQKEGYIFPRHRIREDARRPARGESTPRSRRGTARPASKRGACVRRGSDSRWEQLTHPNSKFSAGASAPHSPLAFVGFRKPIQGLRDVEHVRVRRVVRPSERGGPLPDRRMQVLWVLPPVCHRPHDESLPASVAVRFSHLRVSGLVLRVVDDRGC